MPCPARDFTTREAKHDISGYVEQGQYFLELEFAVIKQSLTTHSSVSLKSIGSFRLLISLSKSDSKSWS